ncbi:hypothetical protein LF1_17670 [Rubripirellula obstinata]|uniref:Uncharacterized protein n=1 Tax=Rubripirellula obstinata TaxID=406547 RepID=A0A5B1CDP5_9BACT|nr:hypothetical protein LF1_17670 [Rubripirellula obstinata]
MALTLAPNGNAVKNFGPGKYVFVRLTAWASPRASTRRTTRGAMPNAVKQFRGPGRCPNGTYFSPGWPVST